MKYSVPEYICDDISPGSNVLVIGPAMSKKRVLADSLFLHGEAECPRLLVTTNNNGSEAHANYKKKGHDVSVVDCSSSQDNNSNENVDTVGSTGDLTGIGLSVNNWYDSIERDSQSVSNRVLFDSLSTLEMYREQKTLFRFLHVLTSRISQDNGLGIFLYDTSGSSSSDIYMQLFDIVLSVNDDGEFKRLSRSQTDQDWKDINSVEKPGNLNSPDSSDEFISDITSSNQTVVISSEDVEKRESIAVSLSTFPVTVERRDSNEESVILKDDENILASSTVRAVYDNLFPKKDPDELASETPEVIEHIDSSVVVFHDVPKSKLLEYSRQIETIAGQSNDGALISGFQDLSRIEDGYGTSRIYQKLSQKPVFELTIIGYNDGDIDFEIPGEVISISPEHYLYNNWFMVFTSKSSPMSMTLFSRENENENYTGFVSRNQEVVRKTFDYVNSQVD